MKPLRVTAAILLCLVFVPYSLVAGLNYLSLATIQSMQKELVTALGGSEGSPGEQMAPNNTTQKLGDLMSNKPVRYGLMILFVGCLQLFSGIALFLKGNRMIGITLLVTAFGWIGVVTYGYAGNYADEYIDAMKVLSPILTGIELLMAFLVLYLGVEMFRMARRNPLP